MMARGKAAARNFADPDSEGWLVSYADLITLLFIFFALIVAMSAVSRVKFDRLAQQVSSKGSTSLTKIQQDLDRTIREQGLQGRVTTEMTDEGLQVRFSEVLLFSSGEARVQDTGVSALQKLAANLRDATENFSMAVEGHTDSRPIRTATFPSNWELSSVRAVNVLHALHELGVSENKMVVRGFADTRPLPGNRIADQQRRVTLLVH
jgi:chemotaxis protein MotB